MLKEVLLMVDYYKLFDSFDHAWVKDFLTMLQFPRAFVNMVHDMYIHLMPIIKLGNAYGHAFVGYNGMGQGDVATLLPALAMVSGQFYMVSLHYPRVRMGACIDDRNFRGPLDDLIQMYAHIAKYDKAAGHFIQTEKTSMAATCKDDQRAIKAIELDGHKPKVKDHDVLTGDIVTTSRRKLRQRANDKNLQSLRDVTPTQWYDDQSSCQAPCCDCGHNTNSCLRQLMVPCIYHCS